MVYVERPLAVAKIEKKLGQKSNGAIVPHAVVLYGIGGTGKTQLVLQYVAAYRHKYSVIIWLGSGNDEDYMWHCARTCRALNIWDSRHPAIEARGTVPQKSVAVNDLLMWLAERPLTDSWLVILDNLEDYWGIRDCMPYGTAGSLMVTSRSSHAANILRCGKIHLDSMEPEEAKAFLRTAAFPTLQGTSDQLDDLCANLSQSLDYHPLAIHLAASAIGTPHSLGTTEDVSLDMACKAVSKYGARLDRDQNDLFMQPSYNFTQSSYNHSVQAAFDSTFEALTMDSEEKKWPNRPSPTRLLALLAFLKDTDVTDMHLKFEKAYRAIVTLRGYSEYASGSLAPWLTKLLTGESTLASWDRGVSTWDSRDYRSALDVLERWGLIRATPQGFPGILPLHRIVAWGVNRKVSLSTAHEFLHEYTVLVELANDFTCETSIESLNALHELTNIYRRIGALGYAEDRGRLHLRKHRERFGAQHSGTIRSLARLVEILSSTPKVGRAEQEIFVYIRDAENRQAVLEVLPAELIMLYQKVFSTQADPKDAQARSPNRLKNSNEKGTDPFSSHIGAGQALQMTTKLPLLAQSFNPEMYNNGLREQLANEMSTRKQTLIAAARTPPDLVTLFEVLSMGSADLISHYIEYIDETTVRYREPLCGRTVLHYMTAYGRLEDVERCIERGSDLEARDLYGARPLHVAGMTGRSEGFHALTAAGADTNAKDELGRTPLQYIQERLPLVPSDSASRRDASLREIVLHSSLGDLNPTDLTSKEPPTSNSHQAYAESASDSDESSWGSQSEDRQNVGTALGGVHHGQTRTSSLEVSNVDLSFNDDSGSASTGPSSSLHESTPPHTIHDSIDNEPVAEPIDPTVPEAPSSYHPLETNTSIGRYGESSDTRHDRPQSATSGTDLSAADGTSPPPPPPPPPPSQPSGDQAAGPLNSLSKPRSISRVSGTTTPGPSDDVHPHNQPLDSVPVKRSEALEGEKTVVLREDARESIRARRPKQEDNAQSMKQRTLKDGTAKEQNEAERRVHKNNRPPERDPGRKRDNRHSTATRHRTTTRRRKRKTQKSEGNSFLRKLWAILTGH